MFSQVKTFQPTLFYVEHPNSSCNCQLNTTTSVQHVPPVAGVSCNEYFLLKEVFIGLLARMRYPWASASLWLRCCKALVKQWSSWDINAAEFWDCILCLDLLRMFLSSLTWVILDHALPCIGRWCVCYMVDLMPISMNDELEIGLRQKKHLF